MRNPLFVSIAILILCLSVVVHISRATEEQPQPVSVEKLVERIAELEARVAKLEKNPPVQVVPLAAERLPSLSRPSVPSNWIPNSINGQAFYYVPLGNSVATSAVQK